MEGWIKDHRQELNSDIWLMPPIYHRVWQWLKYKANHQDREVPLRNGGNIVVKRGQLLTSYRSIAQGVGWKERGKQVIPSPNTVGNIINWLVKRGMVTISRDVDPWNTHQPLQLLTFSGG